MCNTKAWFKGNGVLISYWHKTWFQTDPLWQKGHGWDLLARMKVACLCSRAFRNSELFKMIFQALVPLEFLEFLFGWLGFFVFGSSECYSNVNLHGDSPRTRIWWLWALMLESATVDAGRSSLCCKTFAGPPFTGIFHGLPCSDL